jgi:STE24 endopeptidase
VTAGFFSDLILDLLNLNYIRPELPELLNDKYNPATYRKSQNYLKEHGWFGILVSVISFIAVLLLLLLGGFAWLNDLVCSVTIHPVPAALLFFGILGFVADLAGTPFDIYSTFVIE